MLHERTPPIAWSKSQHNEHRAYEDHFLWFWGRYDCKRTLLIRIAAITLAGDSAITVVRFCPSELLPSSTSSCSWLLDICYHPMVDNLKLLVLARCLNPLPKFEDDKRLGMISDDYHLEGKERAQANRVPSFIWLGKTYGLWQRSSDNHLGCLGMQLCGGWLCRILHLNGRPWNQTILSTPPPQNCIFTVFSCARCCLHVTCVQTLTYFGCSFFAYSWKLPS